MKGYKVIDCSVSAHSKNVRAHYLQQTLMQHVWVKQLSRRRVARIFHFYGLVMGQYSHFMNDKREAYGHSTTASPVCQTCVQPTFSLQILQNILTTCIAKVFSIFIKSLKVPVRSILEGTARHNGPPLKMRLFLSTLNIFKSFQE